MAAGLCNAKAPRCPDIRTERTLLKESVLSVRL